MLFKVAKLSCIKRNTVANRTCFVPDMGLFKINHPNHLCVACKSIHSYPHNSLIICNTINGTLSINTISDFSNYVIKRIISNRNSAKGISLALHLLYDRRICIEFKESFFDGFAVLIGHVWSHRNVI